MNHTALLNQQVKLLEEQGDGVLTRGQNSLNLRDCRALLAINPILVARRKDEVTVKDVKSRRHSLPEWCFTCVPFLRPETGIGGQLSPGRRPSGQMVNIPTDTASRKFIENLGVLSALGLGDAR